MDHTNSKWIQKAKTWFFNELNKLLNSDEGKTEAITLPYNTKFNDSDFNSKKFNQELKNLSKNKS